MAGNNIADWEKLLSDIKYDWVRHVGSFSKRRALIQAPENTVLTRKSLSFRAFSRFPMSSREAKRDISAHKSCVELEMRSLKIWPVIIPNIFPLVLIATGVLLRYAYYLDNWYAEIFGPLPYPLIVPKEKYPQIYSGAFAEEDLIQFHIGVSSLQHEYSSNIITNRGSIAYSFADYTRRRPVTDPAWPFVNNCPQRPLSDGYRVQSLSK